MAEQERQDGNAGGRAVDRPPPTAAGLGMASSVTRHAQITGPREFKYLICGIDSLDLSIEVHWPPEAVALFDELEQKKIEAAGQDRVLWRSTAIGLAMVRASGRAPIYRYRFVVPDFEFFVAKQLEPKKAPNVQVSISARLLWDIGAQAATERAWQLISELSGRVVRCWPARCDLCADFLLDEPLTLEFIRAMAVSRTKKLRPYLDGDRLESIYIGAGGAPIQCRIYDKGLEIMTKGEKFWMGEVWGIENLANVWRAEFQVRREVLKQFGIESVESLLEHASAIWGYLTDEWLSLRLNDDVNTSRRTVHPWWRAIQTCDQLIGPESSAGRNLESSDIASADWFIRHIAGCFCGYAARLAIPDVHQAWIDLEDNVRDYWKEKNWMAEYAKRRLLLGRDPEIDHGGECDVPF